MKTTTLDSPISTRPGRSFCAFLLVLACIPFPAGSEELGRLFFPPERRQMLDRQRQFNIQERKEIPEDPTLTINGVVTRSSGKRTVWINGAAQDDTDVSSGVIASPRAKNPARVVVQGSEAPAAEIGVGGTVNRNTGETADLLGGGRVIIKSRP
ncbi:MAG: hypothetical protein QMB52_11775 [Propionivibrio sp.]